MSLSVVSTERTIVNGDGEELKIRQCKENDYYLEISIGDNDFAFDAEDVSVISDVLSDISHEIKTRY